MNLLVKKIGLVLLPALFFACEDPTELGTNLNPNTGAVSTHYIEIPVNTSQVRTDSLFTAMQLSYSNTGAVSVGNSPYIGRLEHPDFGITKATLYTNIGMPASVPTIGNNVQLDSVKVQLVWNSREVYGGDLIQEQRFGVYRLAEPISPTRRETVRDTVEVLTYYYIAPDSEPLAEQLGQLSLSLRDVTSKLDSAVFYNDVNNRILSGQIDQAFGEQLLMAIKNNTNGLLDNQDAFDNYVKGLAIVPEDINTFVTTYDITNANSGVFLYYTQGTEQRSIRLPFFPEMNTKRQYTTGPSYFGLETERSGTALASADAVGHLQEFDPLDNRVYFQGLTGLLPKVEFKEFKDFILNQEEGDLISINRASLEFDSLYAGAVRQPIPGTAVLYFVDNSNRRFASTLQAGAAERAPSTTMGVYRIGTKDVNYFSSDIVYNLEQYMRTGEERNLQAVLYPGESLLSTPNQFVIRPDQVKLKIWYTKLARPNL
ncbi:DUF4270 family protein [Cesiribacter sp. SM1]|uniref:DUF4270 family protein n=1 Tax=Cesiribacter sp. SM1 TaxID=2861196 RepID=UPI001CD7650E|nr:DUF4270 family protein [Cesiribacter sp. SM1]